MRALLVAAVVAFAGSPALAGSANIWNGFYAGGSIGGAWGNDTVTNSARGVDPGPFKFNFGGPVIGATAGYNAQFGSVVLGVEGDLAYFGPEGSGYIPSTSPGQHQDLTLGDGLLGDLTGRAGVAFGPTLLYAKGGYAFFTGEGNQATTKDGYTPTSTGSFSGWTVGGGVEQMLTPSISVKLEYQHFGFGKESGYQTATVADPPTPVGYRFYNEHDVSFDAVKFGANFHF
jgi:outer membrane immunogenic protein